MINDLVRVSLFLNVQRDVRVLTRGLQGVLPNKGKGGGEEQQGLLHATRIIHVIYHIAYVQAVPQQG